VDEVKEYSKDIVKFETGPKIIRFIKSGNKPKPTDKYSTKRQHKRRLIGVLVSFQHEDQIYIGFSKCNRKDEFDKDIALDIAIGRAMCIVNKKGDMQPYSIPFSLATHFVEFVDRSKRYFKNAELNGTVDQSLQLIQGTKAIITKIC